NNKVVATITMFSPHSPILPDLSGKMFVFPQETNTAHVKLIPANVNLQSLTVCHRSFTDLKRDHSLFSLSSPSHHNEFLVFMSWPSLDYAPNKWHSICTTWNSSSGLVQMWFNGQPLVIKYIPFTLPLTTNPIIIVGQEQDSHGGGFAINQCLVGMMCDVHMWNYEVSPCEILKYMKGEGVTPGNVLNWAALNYQSIGNVLIKDKQSCILS
uniref:Pentraxin (PTX) domain-containing protein n=1 Tax=Neogobius melanostomus TaxID=47308 RepID=A0A8C6SD29_9GOBI